MERHAMADGQTEIETSSPEDGSPGGCSPKRPAFAPWLFTTNAITQQFLSLGSRPEIVNLAGGLPAPQVYPIDQVADIAHDAIAKWGARALGYSAIDGLPELRDAIAARFSSPTLRLGRDNVMITAGSMQALDLLGKVLVDPGETIVGHFPTYLGAIDAWRPRSPTYRHLKIDPANPSSLPPFDGAKFVYVVPNFSNPTGALVGTEMREILLAKARAANVWVVEDDPYGSLVYDGEALPSMQELDSRNHGSGLYDGRVVYLGTLSKTIAPGLRIGWTIAAPEMINALTLAKQGSDLCTGGVQQVIALEAMERGLIEQQAPLITTLYRERRNVLCDALDQHLARWFTWERPTGGMFVWLTVKPETTIDTDVLLATALDCGVAFTPSSVFDPSGVMKRSIRMNFTLNPPDTLREGVARLGRAVETLLAKQG